MPQYERWTSRSVNDRIGRYLNDLSSQRIICKMPEGNVYQVDDYVVKERRGMKGRSRQGPKKSVRREYKVGVIANQLKSRHLVKTYGYVESSRGSQLITGFIDGITLSRYIKNNGIEKSLPIIRHLIIILYYLQRKIGFCHYGLHSSNVMIERLSRPTTFTYTIFDREYRVTSIYNPVIIDLGRSYVHGVPEMYYEGEVIGSLVTPGIFDSQVDVAFLLWSLKSRLRDICPRSYQLLVDNQLLNDRCSLHHCKVSGVPSSLRQNDSLWASRKAVDDDRVVDKYNREARKCKRKIPATMINYYAKQLSSYMVSLKMDNIERRRHCDRSIFKMLIDELDD